MSHHPLPAKADELGITPLVWAALQKIWPEVRDPGNLVGVFALSQMSGMDFTAKPYHIVVRGGQERIEPSIDQARMRAIASGKYAGLDPIETSEASITLTLKTKNWTKEITLPEWARCTVLKVVGPNQIGRWVGPKVYAKEFAKSTPLWASHPEHMLQTRAEDHALRKAFPSHLLEKPIEAVAGIEVGGAASPIAEALKLAPSEDIGEAVPDEGGYDSDPGDPPIEEGAAPATQEPPDEPPPAEAPAAAPPPAAAPAPAPQQPPPAAAPPPVATAPAQAAPAPAAAPTPQAAPPPAAAPAPQAAPPAQPAAAPPPAATPPPAAAPVEAPEMPQGDGDSLTPDF